MQLRGWCTTAKPAILPKCTSRRHKHCRVAASAENSVTPGATVRVTASVVVYHVPKVASVDLKGWEGTVEGDMRNFKGEGLTPNLPWKVRFQKPAENGGKPSKFFAHFRDDELEIAS